jgi:hypothetical protein
MRVMWMAGAGMWMACRLEIKTVSFGDNMKKFTAGLVIGLIVGFIVGTTLGVQWLIAAAQKMSQKPAIELTFPNAPIGSSEKLAEFLDGYPYEIGFFAKDLKTGKTAERSADRSVCLASIVKVFCLTELYRQKHDDSLDIGQKIDVAGHGSISLEQAADLMIGRSDNAATQSLAEFLGRDKVNSIPSVLGIDSMSTEILPDDKTIRQVLDKRINGERVAQLGLPFHGSARGIARYFELLLDGKVISENVSREILSFFSKHPKPNTTHYKGKYNFAGKGGNLLWTRPPKHYSMMGWGLFLIKQGGENIVLCVWGEWFPDNMRPDQQSEFLKFVTDSVIGIVES